MALSAAERQRRYREHHVMVPREENGRRLDLTAVHAAMWEAMDAYNHPADTVPALRQQVWALGRVVHELVQVLDDHDNRP